MLRLSQSYGQTVKYRRARFTVHRVVRFLSTMCITKRYLLEILDIHECLSDPETRPKSDT